MLNTALKYFLTVVNSGSLADAAQKLHVAPSAISRMMRKLEDEYKAQLFERHARGMQLTEAGEILAAYARRTHLETERTRSEILELGHLEQSLIKVAANQAFTAEMLPTIMAEFMRVEPKVRFQLSMLQSSDINARIRKGEEDIGVSYNLAAPKGVEIQYAKRMPLFAIMLPTDPLAKHSSLNLRDVGDRPVAILGAGSTLGFVLDLCCMHEKVSLNVVMVSNHQTAIHSFCREFGSIGFSGDRTLMGSARLKELVAIPVNAEHSHQRQLYIQTFDGRVLPSSIQLFVQKIVQHIESTFDPVG